MLLLEGLLVQEAAYSDDAKTALKGLEAIFNEIKSISSYRTIGRVRLDRLFMDGELSNNVKLADCYSRFANLVEGLEL
jgi:hypothetical protein